MKRGRKGEARKSRAFYRRRRAAGKFGADVLPPGEAEAMRPWRGCGVALLAVAATAVVGWIAAELFFH